MELAAIIVAGFALAVSIWSVLDSRASARRSASAAERSAAAAEREIEMATAYRVPWRLVHDGGSAYRLVNDGEEVAEETMLTCGRAAQSSIIVPDTQPQDVQPHSAIRFVDARHMGAYEPLTVTWRRPGEDTPRTWTHPMPLS